MTAALEGGEWTAARPGRTLPPGKTGYPFYRRLGRTQGRSGRAENLVPTGIPFRTVQPVVTRYTDWATRFIYIYIMIILKESYRNMISRYGIHSSTDGIKSWVQVNAPNILRFLWKAGSFFHIWAAVELWRRQNWSNWFVTCECVTAVTCSCTALPYCCAVTLFTA